MLAHRFVWLQDVAREAQHRLWGALALPHAAQEAWLAAVAMDHQLLAITARTHEPMIGHMRFAWWRELLDEVAAGGAVRPHPLAGPLQALCAAHPNALARLRALLESRHAAFEALAEDTIDAVDLQHAAAETRLLEIAAECCGATVDAALGEVLNALGAYVAGAGRLQALSHSAAKEEGVDAALPARALDDALESERYWAEQAAAVAALPKALRKTLRAQAIIAGDIYAQIITGRGHVFDRPLRHRTVRVPLRLLVVGWG